MHRDGDTRRGRDRQRERDWGIIKIGGETVSKTERGRQTETF